MTTAVARRTLGLSLVKIVTLSGMTIAPCGEILRQQRGRRDQAGDQRRAAQDRACAPLQCLSMECLHRDLNPVPDRTGLAIAGQPGRFWPVRLSLGNLCVMCRAGGLTENERVR
ncbi:hypothetical protein ACFSTD_08930 [Novosphingobium colocasiae]